MSRIQVTPERLFGAAREVEETREQMEDTREELVRLIRWMESMWSGMVREWFLERFEENQPRMIETLESLAHIAKELREIGVRFQQADEVSGAAVAGNVATKSIGLKATQSNDDKGYQMKYDPQFHIWLPVNEKGVTDQAALQAYERDHGKIDVTKMVQPPGANPALEQDLTQLQIEAFELGVNPFTGEPVTDDYAKMMISSLKWSQIVAGIGMVTGSMKSGKGPYKGRGTSAALGKVKQTIRDAKASQAAKGQGGLTAKEVVAPSSGKAIKVYTDGNTIIPIDKVEKYIRGRVNVNIQEVNKELRELKQMRQTQRKIFDADPQNAERIKRLDLMKHNYERSDDMRKKLESIGLNDTPENNQSIAKHLLDVGKNITPENRLDFPSTLKGSKGRVKVLTTWSIVDGKPYLSTIKLIPIKD
ncbi:WXG100 family type VII secretion target [Paenibacillus barcinonensis]|nr:WXG100 family type VII secretion target [Paenibacillus barcinonensis]QKS56151.1 WXG100 family type VII secretion target [Paenibacillus barcinonensis]